MIIYGRRIEVSIAGLLVTEPKMAIEVERKADEEAPDGQVEIYNLAAERAAQIENRGEAITIAAGYGDRTAIIFEGAVDRVVQARRNLEHITRIELGSSVHSVRLLGGITVRTYAGDVPVRTILADVVSDLGLILGPLDAIPAGVMARNWEWASRSDAALTALVRRASAYWYEDDGVIRFNAVGRPQAGVPPFVLSPDTGLLGAPARSDDGVEALGFLNPIARIGAVVDLQSEHIAGRWKLVALSHRGDNWTGQFVTAYTLQPIAAVPPAIAAGMPS